MSKKMRIKLGRWSRRVVVVLVILVGFIIYWKIKYPSASIRITRSPSAEEITKYQQEDVPPYEGEVKRVDDPRGYFSLEVPANWETQELELAGDMKVNFGLIDPNMLVDRNQVAAGIFDVYYKDGAFVVVSVHKGDFESTRAPVPDAVKHAGEVKIGGADGLEFNYRDDIIKAGELWEAKVLRGGDTYVIRFGYDPTGYPEGESVYRKILSSFEFKGA